MSTSPYASIFRRFAAFVIDLPFLIALYHLCDPVCIFLQDAWGFIFDTYIIMYIVFIIVYFCAFECSPMQGTLGKAILGIKLQNSHDDSRITFTTALLRIVVKTFSILFFGFGILPIIFTKKHQGLHDLIAGTVVVKEE